MKYISADITGVFRKGRVLLVLYERIRGNGMNDRVRGGAIQLLLLEIMEEMTFLCELREAFN